MRAWRSANDYAKLGSLILNVETRSRTAVRASYCCLGMDRRCRCRASAFLPYAGISTFAGNSSGLDYGISCFTKVENLQSRLKFYLGRNGFLTTLPRYYRILKLHEYYMLVLYLYLHIEVKIYTFSYFSNLYLL